MFQPGNRAAAGRPKYLTETVIAMFDKRTLDLLIALANVTSGGNKSKCLRMLVQKEASELGIVGDSIVDLSINDLIDVS